MANHQPLKTKDDLSAQDCIFYARCCEQGEKWDDMKEFMYKFVNHGNRKTELEANERNLFAVAFK